MISGKFDYQKFIQLLTSQMSALIPDDVLPLNRTFLKKIMENFCIIAAKALEKDKEFTCSAEDAVLIIKIIAEWTFYKTVDLSRSGIHPKYHRNILAKIAFVIFEVSKMIHNEGLELGSKTSIDIIEHHAQREYKKAIDELKEKDIINEDVAKIANQQSNIDKMFREYFLKETTNLKEHTESSRILFGIRQMFRKFFNKQ